MEKIPITIVTGFLGTGKTTLIKRICSEVTSKRIGVIQNDFSEMMGIEKPILLKAGATVYELPNGCLCCSAKTELVSALDSFVQLSDRIDWIIIESSGASDPMTLAGNLWLDENLESRLRLDGVVTLTDVNTLNLFVSSPNSTSQNPSMNLVYNPKTDSDNPRASNNSGNIDNDNANSQALSPQPSKEPSMGYSELFETFSKQISVSDLIVVNKTDLSPLTDDLRDYLTGINNCRVVESVRCGFDLDLLFNLGSFETIRLLSFDFSSISLSHTATSPLRSVSLRTSAPYSLSFVNDTVASLLWDRSDIFRCKGVFRAVADCSAVGHSDGGVGCFELQGVGPVYEINSIDVDLVDNRFLFIGYMLERSFFENLFSKSHL